MALALLKASKRGVLTGRRNMTLLIGTLIGVGIGLVIALGAAGVAKVYGMLLNDE